MTNFTLRNLPGAIGRRPGGGARNMLLAFCLIFLGMITSSTQSFATSTRYQIESAPAPSGTASFCFGAAGAFTNQAVSTNCTAASTNTNTITWQWMYDGIAISGASSTYVVNASAVPVVTLTAAQANSIPVGVHSLQCRYSKSQANCTDNVAVLSDPLIITVLGPPGAIGGATSVCAGTTATLTNSVAGGTWSTVAGSGSVTISASSGVVTGVTTGTAIISYTTGCGTPVGRVITVNASPAVLTGTTSMCIGTTTTLNSTTSGGTWLSDNTSVATVNSLGEVTPVATGTAGISYTVSGCPRISIVTVNTTPGTFAVTPASTAMCPSSAAALLTAGISSYAGTATFGTHAGTNSSTTYPAVFSQYYGSQRSQFLVLASELTAMGFVNGSSLTAINFEVQSLGSAYTDNSLQIRIAPTSSTSLSGFITAGLSTVRTAANYAPVVGNNNMIFSPAYTWDGTSNLVFDVTFGNNRTGTTTESAIQYYTNTSFNSYVAYNADGVTAASAASSTSVTNGPSNSRPDFILSGTKGAPITWAPIAGLYTNAAATTAYSGGALNAVYAKPTVTTVYTVSGTIPSGCARKTLVPVTVNTVAATTGTMAVCVGGTTTLSNTTGAGTWGSSNTGVATVVAGTGAVTGAGAGTATITFTVTATGCFTTSIVTVNALPTVSGIIVPSSPLCLGSTFSLSAGSVTGTGTLTSYNWSGPSYSAVTATPSASFTATTTASTGIYSLTVTYPGIGCTSAVQTSSTATVNALPTISGMTASLSNVCTGTPIVFTAGTPSGTGPLATYNWRGPNSYSNATPAATNTVTLTPTTTLAGGVYSLTVTYTGTGCTSQTATTGTITVNDAPTLSGASNNGPFCGASTLTLSANTPAHVANYSWTGPVAVTGAATASASVPAATPAASGIYTVTVSNGAGTGCSATYTTSATVKLAPSLSTITNNGPICAGNTLTLSTSGASNVLNYAWNGPVATSTPAAGNTTVASALPSASGIYTLTADNGPGTNCVATYTTSATVNPTPQPFNITGGGSYCVGGSGVPVGLDGSETSTSYQLYNNTSAIGSAVAGTGSAISFGLQTPAGSYTVRATNAATCVNGMTGATSITVGPVPIVYSMLGGGGYCQGGTGVTVFLSNSDVGVTYQLYNDITPVGGLVAGTGIPMTFGLQTAAGTYHVVANPGSTCATSMAGTAPVTINPLPTPFFVTGGGAYCTGGAGVPLGLSGSVTGVNYDLYLGSSLMSTIPGTNSSLDLGPVTTAGTYTLSATILSTGCRNDMTGSATVTVNALPSAFAVTGGGSYCSGGSGVPVGLLTSTTGVNYQLYNGASAVGAAVPGTGGSISFGNQLTAGSYTVLATNPSTCTKAMTGSASVVVNPLPLAFTVAGGGAYCSGGSGMTIGLLGSENGVNYQLKMGAATVGAPVAGTGGGISFGLQTVAGTYSVVATNATTLCTSNMSGSVAISINSLPTAFAVSGGGAYCAGGAGVAIGMLNSTTGINYQLYNGSTAVGAPVGGNNGSITFGVQSTAGTYTVRATDPVSTCTSAMSGSATITINPQPTAFTVTGGGTFCTGSTGVAVGLSFSENGMSYQLYRGSTAVGSTVPGTGGAITFGLQTTSGVYSVSATSGSSCTNGMLGTVTVTAYPVPNAYAVTGTGSYCAGGTGLPVGLINSESGMVYQLYNSALPIGGAVAGTGGSVSFGTITTAGTYTVLATNVSTLCSSAMTGNATITINALPNPQSVTGGGAYCAGGAGMPIGLGGSQNGISYQLYNGASIAGAAVPGTGGGISFGSQTAAGTYTVLATNTTTFCTSNMTGSASIVINALPTAFAVTGGGGYCNGGTGVTIGLNPSSTGTNYQLYNGAAAVGSAVAGTGGAISFGAQLTAGTYTVRATNGASCVNGMSGSATVSINALPAVHAMTGGGTFCASTGGIAIGLDAADAGINYQLYNGSIAIGAPVAGAPGALSFGLQTAAGTYSVRATNATTNCTSDMTGTATISINPAPFVYAMTGGGNYCAGGTGVAVGLSGSNTGINYQLYNGATAIGAPVPGTGTGISFGVQTLAATYSVLATNTTTNCTSNMTGTAVVLMNSLPTTQNVTGGGGYCNGGTGVNVGLSGSTLGVVYQLYNGVATVGGLTPGTGLALDFGLMTNGGTYTVMAFNPVTSCASPMGGSAVVTVNPLPTVYPVTGGGAYCAGGTGVNIGVGASNTGVEYQLYNGSAAVGSPVAGITGSGISFGLKTAAGTYSVLATNTATTCTNNMAGTTTISINSLPNVYSVMGGGTICNGTAGVSITLPGSNSGVDYQLYNGATATGTPVAGTGSGISFGLQNAAGTYTIVATNPTTSCTRNMSGSATVVVNPLPTQYAVTGGGAYCANGAGMPVGLVNSNSGISYQLYNGSTPVGSPVTGSGPAISFGLQAGAGTYSVLATNISTSCTRAMSGSATISINSLPLAYNISAGGSYCDGGTGVGITLSGSNNGISYQLYNDVNPVGAALGGTGGMLNFGAQTDAGNYMVIATNTTTTCNNTMNGSAAITIDPLPDAFGLSGGGNYCAGGAGMAITLNGSVPGINYQLYNGAAPVGAPVPGTGGDLDMGMQTAAGAYSVLATNTATGCRNAMSNSTIVGINPLPVRYNVTGGGTMCQGATGVMISLSNSDLGIDYQLYNGIDPVGASVPGTGAGIDLGAQTTAGTFTVLATDATTLCTRAMTGSKTVIVNPLPDVQTVTGGGDYCAGGTGMAVGLTGSATGVAYQLYNGTTATGSAVPGTGNVISFGPQIAGGTYTVQATITATGCTRDMAGLAIVNVNALPTTYNVLGLGSSYCAGDIGVNILLSNSDNGIDYQLYNGSTPAGLPVPGTGGTIDFGPQTNAGVYMVVANNSSTTCSKNMNGTAAVIVNPLPTAYTVTGGGGYCNGTAGAAVGLSSSNTGISYQLYDGVNPVGTAVAGNGGAISFGQQPAGTYMAIATNNISNCSSNMLGTVTATVTPLPSAFAVTGGGTYCAGGAGMAVGLGGSATGISYQLYNSTGAVGTPVAGTGAAFSFGMQTGAGNYSVVATNTTTTCTNNMTGSVTVSVNAVPAAFNMTGGGSYCDGGAGRSIGLGGSATNVTYQLWNGSATVGAPMPGTGSALDFGMQMDAGSYSVVATSDINSCTNTMTGAATIVVNTLPAVYTVTGGGNYCTGGAGVAVGLNNSAPGTSYQLYNGVSVAGLPVAGTGSAISFGLQASAGAYTVLATNPGTTCSSAMDGIANVVANATVTPAVSVSTGVGTTVCLGVLTTFTATPVNGGTSPEYQWQVNGAPVGLGLSAYSYVPVDGDVVSVAMTSNAACVSTPTAGASVAMTVSSSQLPQANITVSPNDTVCQGTTVTYTVAPAFGGTAPLFIWKKNGVVVSASTSYTYSPSNGDMITCTVVSNFPCRLADSATSVVKMRVETLSTPVVEIAVNPGVSVSAGEKVTLTANVTNASAALSYKWKVNSATIIGATDNTYISANFSNNDIVSCEVTSTTSCGDMMGSSSVVMKITTGVGSLALADNDIRLLPNPNKGTFMIKGTLGTADDHTLHAEVTDMLGQVVYTGAIQARGGIISENIQLGKTLANGMYILNLHGETGSKVFHFIIEQ